MGIFASSKILTLESAANPDTVTATIMDGVSRDSIGRVFSRHLAGISEVVGYCDGDIIKLQFKNNVRNSLRPTMNVHITESSTGGTIVSTCYSTALAAKVFMIVWFGMALLISVVIAVTLITQHGAILTALPVLFFPVFGLIVVSVMRVFARMDEERLEEFVRSRVEDAEHQCQDNEPTEKPDSSRKNSFIHKYRA